MSTNVPNFLKSKQVRKLSEGCQYLMLLSGRNDGKSYAVKAVCLEDAYNSINVLGQCTKQIAYMRRFDLDCKDSMLEPYFADMPIQEITKGEFTHVFVYHKDIYFGTVDEKTGRHLKKVLIGRCFAINMAEHYKSQMFPFMRNGIVEEIVSKKGEYIFNEPEELQHMLSSIFRGYEGVHIYMIGNTLSPVCPYYYDWGLVGTEDIEPGETKQYQFDDTVIRVHRPNPSGFNAKLFFGSARNEITQGEYVVNSCPHLKKRLRKYIINYTMVMEQGNFKFLVRLLSDPEDGSVFWYAERKTTKNKPGTRIISDNWYDGNLYTPKLVGITKEEQNAFNLIKIGKIVFSDNLTGTLFNNFLIKWR